MSCSLSQHRVWTVWSPKALSSSLLPHLLVWSDSCSWLSSGHSTLPHQLCCVRLFLTRKMGGFPGVRTLKANIISHHKWQSRISSHPCQNYSHVTPLTLILISLHAGEQEWVTDDNCRIWLPLVKPSDGTLLSSSFARGSCVNYHHSPMGNVGHTW